MCYQVINDVAFREKGEALARELGGSVEFSAFNLEDASAVRAAIDGVDLVVHAAGPFQRRVECAVLEAAIDTKVSLSLSRSLALAFF